MNELLDDVPSNDPVIARLRSALDEVSADSHGLVAADAPRPSVSAGRWMAAAAAVVLIVGAVTAIAINRRNAPEVASTPTEAATTSPTTSEPELIRSVTPWFSLVAADLGPGERTLEQCCSPTPPGQELVMAWSRADPAAYLMVTEYPEPGPSFAVGATLRQGTSGMLSFVSYGLTDDERGTLSGQLVPGSGLPYVLPVDGWEMTAIGSSEGENRSVQMYTPLDQDPLSNYLPTVTMSVGEYRGELSWLAGWPDPQPVTVAGYDGWKVTEGDGTVSVFWNAGDGNWATLRIDPTLADRTDELIAGVIKLSEEAANQPTVETVLAPAITVAGGSGEVTIVGDPLPLFEQLANDTAIGLPAPRVWGHDFDGNEVTINPAEGAHLVVFVAHWCPHCNAELPLLVQAAADGTLPSWLPITLVSTAESTTAPNHPPQPWLAEQGWTGRVIEDGSQGDGAAGTIAQVYGASGWPYFVLIGSDGTVVARSVGEISVVQLQELIATLPAP